MNTLAKIFIVFIFLFTASGLFYFFAHNKPVEQQIPLADSINEPENQGGIEKAAHPLSIPFLREQDFPGSDVVIEETLTPGSNYKRYRASYMSEGLKIYALLTVPNGEKPETGWPVIIFNHGYIPPSEYRTTERYIAYTDGFSRNGYIVFRSDYRGHGSSEGIAAGGYGTNDYTIDVLNATATMKRYSLADPNRIGMWGHSMGGYITLRNMVVSKDIKAGVIWGGVIASYPDMLSKWRRPSTTPMTSPSQQRRGWRQQLSELFGTPEENPEFWQSISANSFLADISGPIELHHGDKDESVPVEFSEILKKEMDQAAKPASLYIYPGDDHNISKNFSTAMNRSIAFFDRYVKNSK